MRTAVDAVIFAHVDGTREDIRRHIGNQGYGRSYVVTNFGTIDGVVCGNVEIVGIGRDYIILGNIAVELVL